MCIVIHSVAAELPSTVLKFTENQRGDGWHRVCVVFSKTIPTPADAAVVRQSGDRNDSVEETIRGISMASTDGAWQ